MFKAQYKNFKSNIDKIYSALIKLFLEFYTSYAHLLYKVTPHNVRKK